MRRWQSVVPVGEGETAGGAGGGFHLPTGKVAVGGQHVTVKTAGAGNGVNKHMIPEAMDGFDALVEQRAEFFRRQAALFQGGNGKIQLPVTGGGGGSVFQHGDLGVEGFKRSGDSTDLVFHVFQRDVVIEEVFSQQRE